MKALKDVMDAVAPPISEHEVIEVNLSHDMVGYEGVETLVYRALAKVSELEACPFVLFLKSMLKRIMPRLT